MLYSVIKEFLAAFIGKTDCKTKSRWRSVDALLTLIFRKWLDTWVCLFCTSRRQIRRKWTVTYTCQYFTINSRISGCDQKYETWNAEPEIGTSGSSQTRRNPRIDGYRSGFGPPRVSGSGFWTVLEPNRPVLAVQTRTAGGLPRPVANTNCGLATCKECEHWIQTSSHSYTGIPFTLWLLCSDNVAVFRCAWRSRGWYCDEKA